MQVCTSKSVSSVVDTLLRRGCSAHEQNKEGETPMHLECRNMRVASMAVVKSLLHAGAPADPPVHSGGFAAPSPLSLVLKGGQEAAANSFSNISNKLSDSFDGGTDRTRSGDRRIWVPLAELLVKSGALWSTHMSKLNQEMHLHLLLRAYPPPQDQAIQYSFLVHSALKSGLDPLVENNKGRNSIFIFCEVCGRTAGSMLPESQEILSELLWYCPSDGVGIMGTDRSGMSVFDIKESVPGSALSRCRKLLQSWFDGTVNESDVQP